jgi:hypothetical protein
MDQKEYWSESSRDFFLGKDFTQEPCNNCQLPYYRPNRSSRLNSCESLKCAGEYAFLNKPRRLGYRSLTDTQSELVRAFNELGYNSEPSQSIISKFGKNLFIASGGQVIDEQLWKDETQLIKNCVVAQPVIKLFSYGFSETQGFASSFQNICTESVGDDFSKHLDHIWQWTEVLGSLGIYVGDITFDQHVSKTDWGLGEFSQYVTTLNYLGLELGNFNFSYQVPTAQNGKFDISDCSFGLERITWALNKTPFYFHSVGPMPDTFDPHLHSVIDFARTSILMTGSGVVPEGKGHGQKLKALTTNRLTLASLNPDYLNFHYNRWQEQGYNHLTVDRQTATEIVISEWNRQRLKKNESSVKLSGYSAAEVDQSLSKTISVRKDLTFTNH